MGDFNISKHDISQFLSKYNLSWNILDLTVRQLTCHTSCIDHILANDKMMKFINQSLDPKTLIPMVLQILHFILITVTVLASLWL